MRTIRLLLFVFGVLAPAAGLATEALPPVVGPHPPVWRYNNASSQEAPFTRSKRAQALWNDGACWSECGAYCAWAMNGCLYRDTQGVCLAYTDACDRYCQVNCRSRGGPFLPIE